jgi:hypothetical protein
VTALTFDLHILLINDQIVSPSFHINVLDSVCLFINTSFALIGQDHLMINTDNFDLRNMAHINLKIPLHFLKPSNGIVSAADYWIKSLSIFSIIMSQEQLLLKFALPFTPRVEEGFDCFLWFNRHWLEDIEKYKRNIIDNCRVILKLELNDAWFSDPRPKFFLP